MATKSKSTFNPGTQAKAKAVAKRETNMEKYTRYNEEVHDAIVQAVRDGNSFGKAGLLAGLGKDTVWLWIEHGRKRPEKYPHFAQLVQDMEEARAQLHNELVDSVKSTALSGAPNTWQAAAWILERQAPEEWGRKDRVEMSGEVNTGPTVQVNQVILVDPSAREASRDFLRRFAGVGPDVAIGPGMGGESEAGEGPTGPEPEPAIEVDALEVD